MQVHVVYTHTYTTCINAGHNDGIKLLNHGVTAMLTAAAVFLSIIIITILLKIVIFVLCIVMHRRRSTYGYDRLSGKPTLNTGSI